MAEGITLTDVAEEANEQGIILRNKSPLPQEKSQGLCFALLKRRNEGKVACCRTTDMEFMSQGDLLNIFTVSYENFK